MDIKRACLVYILPVLFLSGLSTALLFFGFSVDGIIKGLQPVDHTALAGSVLSYENYHGNFRGNNLNWGIPEPEMCHDSEMFQSQGDPGLMIDNRKIQLATNDLQTAWIARYGNAVIEVRESGNDLVLLVREANYERAHRESDI